MLEVSTIKIPFAAQDSSAMLRSLLENKSSSIKDISKAIKRDPKMTVFVLNIVNNTIFGFEEQIDDIGRAVDLLGVGQMKDLIGGNKVLSHLLQIRIFRTNKDASSSR